MHSVRKAPLLRLSNGIFSFFFSFLLFAMSEKFFEREAVIEIGIECAGGARQKNTWPSPATMKVIQGTSRAELLESFNLPRPFAKIANLYSRIHTRRVWVSELRGNWKLILACTYQNRCVRVEGLSLSLSLYIVTRHWTTTIRWPIITIIQYPFPSHWLIL